MRLLLDECIDERLRHAVTGHDCVSVRFAGFAGLKNGALLTAAEAAGFDDRPEILGMTWRSPMVYPQPL